VARMVRPQFNELPFQNLLTHVLAPAISRIALGFSTCFLSGRDWRRRNLVAVENALNPLNSTETSGGCRLFTDQMLNCVNPYGRAL
jgi:hypothetical protein